MNTRRTRQVKENITPETKSIFSKFKKSTYYNPYYIFRKRALFVTDVVFFLDKEMVNENDGYGYLLTCIDAFTKMAWVKPLKKIKPLPIKKAFTEIFNECGEKPQKIMSDKGGEFNSKVFQNLMKKKKLSIIILKV